MAKNKKSSACHKSEDDYLLTTKLFCDYCFAYLYEGSGAIRSVLVHYYYKFVTFKKHHGN